jgi:hypothetical protein
MGELPLCRFLGQATTLASSDALPEASPAERRQTAITWVQAGHRGHTDRPHPDTAS